MITKKPFPYCIVGHSIHPILGKGFEHAPGYVSLGEASEHLPQIKSMTQKDFNAYLEDVHRKQGVTWSLSGDRENRTSLYAQDPNKSIEARTVHIGLDLNAPAGTPIHSPFDAEVIKAEYDAGDGNYGWFCVLKHSVGGTTFYTLYGHVAEKDLAPTGKKLRAGDVFARIGDLHENGNWFHHVHLQVLTERGYEEGWIYKGLCTKQQLLEIDELCPSPMPLLMVLCDY